MSNKLHTLKRLIHQFLGLFPSQLPTGVGSFETWAKSISETYTMPTEDQRSINYALATMVMHLGPDVASKSKYSFAKQLRASAAKQVAGDWFYRLKTQQQEEAKAKAEALNVQVSG